MIQGVLLEIGKYINEIIAFVTKLRNSGKLTELISSGYAQPSIINWLLSGPSPKPVSRSTLTMANIMNTVRRANNGQETYTEWPVQIWWREDQIFASEHKNLVITCTGTLDMGINQTLLLIWRCKNCVQSHPLSV